MSETNNGRFAARTALTMRRLYAASGDSTFILRMSAERLIWRHITGQKRPLNSRKLLPIGVSFSTSRSAHLRNCNSVALTCCLVMSRRPVLRIRNSFLSGATLIPTCQFCGMRALST
jgi:hypothetical protein